MAIAHGTGLPDDLYFDSAAVARAPIRISHVTSVTSLSARRNGPAALNKGTEAGYDKGSVLILNESRIHASIEQDAAAS
jgi:hypothetical protein